MMFIFMTINPLLILTTPERTDITIRTCPCNAIRLRRAGNVVVLSSLSIDGHRTAAATTSLAALRHLRRPMAIPTGAREKVVLNPLSTVAKSNYPT